MSYKLKVTTFNKDNFKQLAVGGYGSNGLPVAYQTAVDNQDIEFFISHAAPLGSRTKKGAFRRKEDALVALKNIEIMNHSGGMYLKVKTGESFYGILVEIT